MKYLLLSLLLASTAPVFAQSAADKAPASTPQQLPVDPDTKLITYSGVVEVPGATQQQLYDRAAAWIAGTAAYRVGSSAQLRETQDKDKIVVKGETLARSGPANSLGVVTHSLSIYLKDGRFKYIITDLREDVAARGIGAGGAFENEKPACGAMYMFNHIWTKIKNNTDKDINDLISRMKTAMVASKNPADF